GVSRAAIAGALVAGDGGDYFALGNLNTGNSISLSVSLPSFGTLASGNVMLSIERAGGVALVTSTSGALNYTLASDGSYYARIQGLSNLALRAQYLLDVT